MNVKVGDTVCDCRFEHHVVVQVIPEGRDSELVLDDGFRCSLRHCAAEVPHTWEHPKYHRDAQGEIVFESPDV